jgi:hypothetical protein
MIIRIYAIKSVVTALGIAIGVGLAPLCVHARAAARGV